MSYDTAIPPSLPMRTWSELAGLIQIAWTSSCVANAASCSNERPPSIVIQRPTPPRYTRSGLLGSIRTWLKYIGRGFPGFTKRQVFPPSSERHKPVVGFDGAAPPARPAAPPPPPPRPAEGPSINAYTKFPLRLKMSRAILPNGPSGSPLPLRRVQVSPPSFDRQMPLPGPPPFMQQALRTRWYVDANSTRGLVADITRSLAPVHSSTRSTCFQVRPPSVVL